MDHTEIKNMLKRLCDEDVSAAIAELKLNLTMSAEELNKIYSCAFRHAQTRISLKLCVRDAMTQDVFSVNKFDDITHVVKLLAEKNISGLPVIDRENRVVGMVSEADVVSTVGATRSHTFKDLLKHVLGHQFPEKKMGHIVGDIMTAPAITITDDAEISEAVRLMDERRIRRLPVIDKAQKLVGLISRADIVKTMGERL